MWRNVKRCVVDGTICRGFSRSDRSPVNDVMIVNGTRCRTPSAVEHKIDGSLPDETDLASPTSCRCRRCLRHLKDAAAAESAASLCNVVASGQR